MALVDRGRGLIYDTDLDITWMQDANYAKTIGHSPDGSFADWADAIRWVCNLRYAGYSDWRLPTAEPGCDGDDCVGGEIGHLWLVEGPQLQRDPFINEVIGAFTAYWTGTEDDSDSTQVWVWQTEFLKQTRALKTPDDLQKIYRLFVWPVRNGDSPAPPVFRRFVSRFFSRFFWRWRNP